MKQFLHIEPLKRQNEKALALIIWAGKQKIFKNKIMEKMFLKGFRIWHKWAMRKALIKAIDNF